jgi:sulfur carrier protein ThiS
MRKTVFVLLTIAGLILAGCGPAVMPQNTQTESGEQFVVALPQLVIDFDAAGNPSIMGMNLVDAGKMIGQDLSGLSLNNMYIAPGIKLVDSLMAADVQTIELRQTGDGVAVLVNGKPLPHIAWTDESLKQMTDVAAMFNVQGLDLLKKVLPIVRRLGVNVVLRLPPAPGAEVIPLTDPNIPLPTPQADDGPDSVVAHMEVKYDGQGVPSILGISARDLQAMGLNLPLALAPSVIQALQANNIKTMELRSKPDGIFVYANDVALPNLSWDNTMLLNAADLYGQMNPTSPYVAAVKQFLPAINNVNIDLKLHFPTADGQ